jgi:hypothetical protein
MVRALLRPGWGLAAAVLALAAIACGSAAPAAPAGPPVTPAIILPPEWTPTPDTAASLPEGWQPLLRSGVELWLPPSFDGGDPATRRDELIENIRALGSGYENLVASLESGAPGMLFLAFDTDMSGATVGITRRDLPASVGLGEYLEAYVAELPGAVPGLVVLGHGTMTLAGEEVGKVTLDVTTEGATSTQVGYILHRGDNLYTVSYAAPKEVFPGAEPAFEVSIGSFRETP